MLTATLIKTICIYKMGVLQEMPLAEGRDEENSS
jgi:hypothetical protein